MSGMDVSRMEPMLVEEYELALEDTAAKLLADANGLAKRMHPILRDSVGTLVRSMNCYYSNLRLGLPIGAVERWFPRLYPANAGGSP